MLYRLILSKAAGPERTKIKKKISLTPQKNSKEPVLAGWQSEGKSSISLVLSPRVMGGEEKGLWHMSKGKPG